MIPNLLKLALSVLPKQDALLHRWQGRETNAVGLDVNTYAPAEPLGESSVQPVERSRYGYMGLDAAKSYVSVYSATPINDLSRTKNPDHITWNGRRHEVLNRADWTAPAGFNGVMAVDIGPAEKWD